MCSPVQMLRAGERGARGAAHSQGAPWEWGTGGGQCTLAKGRAESRYVDASLLL